jgi:hypothetical protein
LLELSRRILTLTEEMHGLAGSFVDRKEITALAKEIRALAGSAPRP